jgi:two-component system, NtrC family, nitrogen regulation sensor histidine kinase NtrY
LIERCVALETRLAVNVVPGPAITISADEDQLEQMLINLLKNAVDAALETDGSVTLNWNADNAIAEISIVDEGRGLPETANLFVPFFTTKPNGSGIGLALSRQIAEAHKGSLTLQNRSDLPGCIALVRLPLLTDQQ